MEGRNIEILDTTLRDGAQGEGISFSLEDKLNITRKLVKLGVSFVEAGNPASNPKDIQYFQRVSGMDTDLTSICAFGSTRKKETPVEEDQNVRSLLDAGTDWVVIFGKSWDLHVRDVLRTTLEENLAMIRDTVAFFRGHGRHVIFDAEHFFDGFKNAPEYALQALKTAEEAGAERLCLCDTNGACFPDDTCIVSNYRA